MSHEAGMLNTESTPSRGHDGRGAVAARVAPRFPHEQDARGFLERLRWPEGPTCPHCDNGGAYRLTAKATSKRPVRQGVLKCRACHRQFTVTVGTIFEGSHVPLRKWLLGIQLLCASENGVSGHQLARELGTSYRTAALMLRRLRAALARLPRFAPTVHPASGNRDGSAPRGDPGGHSVGAHLRSRPGRPRSRRGR